MQEGAARRAGIGHRTNPWARRGGWSRAAGLAGLLLAAWPWPASSADVSGLYFFGDSLTDEGRAGRSAPVIWSQVLRRDLAVATGGNYAIGGATTHDQPSAAFGDSSFLGQVRAFLATTTVPPDAEVAVWIGTNDVWIGAAQGRAPDAIAADASAAVRVGIEALARAGVRRAVVLGVYDLSLTNAFAFVGVDTPAVRAVAAAASRLLNERLRGLAVPGVSITFFDVATFVDHLRADATALGFAQVRPLRPGERCDATCQRTSIFDDTIHLSERTQTLVGDYVASGSPSFNDLPLDYGAAASSTAAPSARPATRSTLRRMLDWIAAWFGGHPPSDRNAPAEGPP